MDTSITQHPYRGAWGGGELNKKIECEFLSRGALLGKLGNMVR